MLDKVQERMKQEGHTLLHFTRSGSYLFGTMDEYSDTDYMGVFLPNKKSMLLGNHEEFITMNTSPNSARNTPEDVDCTLISLQRFFTLLGRGDFTAIELLFSHTNTNATILTTDVFLNLYRPMLVSRSLSGMVGYAKSQLKSLSGRTPGTDRKEHKRLYHALRVSDEITELHATGSLEFPLFGDSYYKKIKSGEISAEEVIEQIQTSLIVLGYYEEGSYDSKLGKEVDTNYMDSVVLMCYEE